jgi:5-methylcytosine-specific restriction endonuclease McrA
VADTPRTCKLVRRRPSGASRIVRYISSAREHTFVPAPLSRMRSLLEAGVSLAEVSGRSFRPTTTRGHTVRDCQERFGFSSATWSNAVRRGDAVARPTEMPIEELLRGSRNRTHLKGRLLKAGLLSTLCAECGIATWRGRALALELHHINGDGRDNRLENLTLLCPNCHSQTDSWGGRNTRRSAALRSEPAARRARSRR